LAAQISNGTKDITDRENTMECLVERTTDRVKAVQNRPEMIFLLHLGIAVALHNIKSKPQKGWSRLDHINREIAESIAREAVCAM
jgi:hypothetical protein